MENFKLWLESSGVSQSDVARALGVTRQAVQSWHCGRIIPGLYYSLALEALSGGKIPATGWLTQEQRLALAGLAAVHRATQEVA